MPISAEEFHARIEAILPRVEKPHRYLGAEANAIRKPPESVEVHVALVFPEVYEIGMSWQGQQILYHALNQRPGVFAERAYAVWPDMEAEMRRAGVAAFSLETWTPLAEFSILGFTLQYELTFTNLLAALDLAGLPLRSRERDERHPLILAGGPAACNPEPLADFLDAVALGDGEEVFPEICEAWLAWKRAREPRPALLDRLARIEGVYVPSLYDVEYEDRAAEGWRAPAIRRIHARAPAPPRVRRRWAADLNRAPFPDAPLVPLGKTVQSRLAVEAQRGCTRACRFCQAGYIYRPARQREPETLRRLIETGLRATGHDEVSLLSLSIGDYGCLDPLLASLTEENRAGGAGRVAVSLPSIRVDTLTGEIIERIAAGRRTGFTVAPEAGSPRLRRVINKPLSEEQIEEAAERVFRAGWRHIKFYYMIGLPTETDEDILGIVRTARACQAIGRRFTSQADIHVSTSTFTPKPFTPFQWEPQIPREEIERKQAILKEELRKTRLTYRWGDARLSFLEAVFSRGGRRLGAVLERAMRLGARFDGWSDRFREDVWREAFAAEGIEPEFYALRRIPASEPLPWDALDYGVTAEWLLRDAENARRERATPDCATGHCYDCGVCDFERVHNQVYLSRESGWIPQGREPGGRGARPEWISTAALRDSRETREEAETVPLRESEARRTRVRVRFEKRGRAAWLSHLDLMETMARAFRRAGARVAYSEGRHPMPRFSFGPALMTGAESECEYFDVILLADAGESNTGALPPEVFARINAGLPEGLRLLASAMEPEASASLGAAITGFVFDISPRLPGALPGSPERREAAARYLALAEAPVTAKKKTYDTRKFTERLAATEAGFRLALRCGPDGSAKPTDVIRAALGWDAPERAHSLLARKIATRFSGGDPAFFDAFFPEAAPRD